MSKYRYLPTLERVVIITIQVAGKCNIIGIIMIAYDDKRGHICLCRPLNIYIITPLPTS